MDVELAKLLRACKAGDCAAVTRSLQGREDVLLNAQDRIYGESAIMVACFNSLDVTRLLLHIPSIDVNLTDKFGSSPLHFAAQAGRHGEATVELLLENGADVAAVDGHGRTPYEVAFGAQRTAVASLLLLH